MRSSVVREPHLRPKLRLGLVAKFGFGLFSSAAKGFLAGCVSEVVLLLILLVFFKDMYIYLFIYFVTRSHPQALEIILYVRDIIIYYIYLFCNTKPVGSIGNYFVRKRYHNLLFSILLFS